MRVPVGAVDCAAAVLSAAVLFVGEASTYAPPSMAPRVLLAVVVCLPVAARRRRPVWQLGAVLLLGALATLAVGGATPWVCVPVGFVLYQVVSTGTGPVATVASTVTLAVLVAQTVGWHLVGRGGGNPTDAVLALVGVWVVGDAVRRHRMSVDIDRARAAQDAVVEERLRIARDLHDVVAHGMSVIAVQAAYGHYVFDNRPTQARDALGTIETASRQVLDEMRHLVGALRPVAGVDAAPLRPTPGLVDIAELVARTADAGVRVDVRQNGTPGKLAPGVGLTAYRVVQEALTNVVRHAGVTRCDLTLCYGADALTVEITDTGGGPPSDRGDGHGLTGMRERVGLYGGDVDAGPRTGGGYRVAARIPFAAAP